MTTTTPSTRRVTTLAAPAEDDWRNDGECRSPRYDPDLWHPSGEGPAASAQEEEAKRICNTRCGVRDLCLAWALERREDIGVWGGMSQRERRRLHGRKPTYRKPAGLTAMEFILRKQLAQFQALEAQGLEPLEIARALQTNVQTVNNFRARLAQQTQESMEVAA